MRSRLNTCAAAEPILAACARHVEGTSTSLAARYRLTPSLQGRPDPLIGYSPAPASLRTSAPPIVINEHRSVSGGSGLAVTFGDRPLYPRARWAPFRGTPSLGTAARRPWCGSRTPAASTA